MVLRNCSIYKLIFIKFIINLFDQKKASSLFPQPAHLCFFATIYQLYIGFTNTT